MHFAPAAENPLITRADVQQLVRDLIAPLRPHFSPGRARVTLGAALPWYGEPAASLEGFARPLWGLIPLAAGGGVFEDWAHWRAGLIHGTDPAHPEFWGEIGDRDQRSVEAPALALAAALVPQEMWTPLAPVERARAAAWLARINHVELADNNWRYFRVLTNLALRRLGEAWSRERLAADVRRLEEFYLRDGWYRDGLERIGDYYVPMAFHVYGLIATQLAEPAEAEWTNALRARSRRFAVDFQHWFNADGEAIPFGRSLTYRFAQGAFWGALAYAGEEALPWVAIRGLWLRHLRSWMRQPIFSETGLLTVGYAYPNQLMAENYNGPGSPYWALKAFLPLALPETHPFWSAAERPLPARPTLLAVPAAGLIVTSDPGAHQVVALNAGQPVAAYPRHAAAKYSKFAYATHAGFGVPATDGGALTLGGFDSVLALSDDGRRFRPRDTCRECQIADNFVRSSWQPWPDVEVCTWLIAAGAHHVRVHRIRSGRALWSSDAGFLLGFSSPTDLAVVAGSAETLQLASPLGGSAVRDLGRGRTSEHHVLEPLTGLSHPLTAMPTLRGIHPPGVCWLVGAFATSPDRAVPLALELGALAVDGDRPGAPSRISQGSTPIFTFAAGVSSATP